MQKKTFYTENVKKNTSEQTIGYQFKVEVQMFEKSKQNNPETIKLKWKIIGGVGKKQKSCIKPNGITEIKCPQENFRSSLCLYCLDIVLCVCWVIKFSCEESLTIWYVENRCTQPSEKVLIVAAKRLKKKKKLKKNSSRIGYSQFQFENNFRGTKN